MKKRKQLFIYFIILLILCGGLFYGGMVFQKNNTQSEITSSIVESELKEANDLISTNYTYSRIGKYENSLDLNGWTIPLTNKSFLLQYNGTLLYGLNLDQFDIQVNNDTITIHTPDIKILSHSIDESSIQIYDEKNNLFNPIQVSDYKKFAISAKKEAVSEAKEKGVEDTARQNAKKAIKKIIKLIPGTDSYQIKINIGDINA